MRYAMLAILLTCTNAYGDNLSLMRMHYTNECVCDGNVVQTLPPRADPVSSFPNGQCPQASGSVNRVTIYPRR